MSKYPYIPHTDEEIKEMLDVVGVSSLEDLFSDIPEEMKMKGELDLPASKSEGEVFGYLSKLAKKNKTTSDLACFMGGGAYDHYIPSVVSHITGRSEFYTAYTPYQPEVSQGTLQYIFEYQTLMANLTGMDYANASLYDGQSAVAEAAIMTAQMSKKNKIAISETADPQAITVLRTYTHARGMELVIIPRDGMVTSLEKAKEIVDETVGTVIIQSPNFYGYIEDMAPFVELAHSQKKRYIIQSTDPTSLPIMKKPGELGVDVVVGDGQAFGIPLQFGGPYLGILAFNKPFIRKIPGRIVGQTEDMDGKRSWVLTLSAREQHIKRERATSNICSNQGLNVLAATVYMSSLGKKGMKEVSYQCIAKSHYLFEKLSGLDKVKVLTDRPFFKEFTIGFDKDADEVLAKLEENGILGGISLSRIDESLGNGLIIAVTEKRTKEEMDTFVKTLEEVL
ncbi:MAG: aminomethyl-transferring glycine dehydrogenase subunit GcvPA [Miniphocaeibacter sp.]|uniref:aminomethyl-transferring glycine dehydrogenase subunit GcvPA n=1 Tax=Miniphocaeibacter sp. TaxID=3100973 RepID=UPI0017CF0661|nr:aminomethyl-transferring glycine dehydrogenase subunit GcvPA [Gallicola sp.]